MIAAAELYPEAYRDLEEPADEVMIIEAPIIRVIAGWRWPAGSITATSTVFRGLGVNEPARVCPQILARAAESGFNPLVADRLFQRSGLRDRDLPGDRDRLVRWPERRSQFGQPLD